MLVRIKSALPLWARAFASQAAPSTPAEIHASFMKRLNDARTRAQVGGGVERIEKQVCGPPRMRGLRFWCRPAVPPALPL